MNYQLDGAELQELREALQAAKISLEYTAHLLDGPDPEDEIKAAQIREARSLNLRDAAKVNNVLEKLEGAGGLMFVPPDRLSIRRADPHEEELRQSQAAATIVLLEGECLPLLVALARGTITLEHARDAIYKANEENPNWFREKMLR